MRLARRESLLENPIAVGRHPSFELAVTIDEDPLLAIQVDPLPAFQFILTDSEAAKIANGLLEIVNTPRGMRLQPRTN